MVRTRPTFVPFTVAVALVIAGAVLAGVVRTGVGRSPDPAAQRAAVDTIRLGYLPNLTHATAIVGIGAGTFAGALGRTRLEAKAFNAGPDAASALMSGAVDAAYLGPNPATNAFLHSDGEAVRVVACAASGGAALVVAEGIRNPSDLRGARLATPQLGGTQDVALRWWLAQHGIVTDPQGGGEVEILPQGNGQTLAAFRQGILDGAWLPEPWASRLVLEGGAHVLVDEREALPAGSDVTTVLAVRTEFLEHHADAVDRLLRGQVAANRFIGEHPAAARRLVSRTIRRITGQTLADDVIASAWGRTRFGDDLEPDALARAAGRAHSVGLLARDDVTGLFEPGPLRRIASSDRRIGARER